MIGELEKKERLNQLKADEKGVLNWYKTDFSGEKFNFADIVQITSLNDINIHFILIIVDFIIDALSSMIV